MPSAEISRLHGTVSLRPTDDVVAGSYGTWTLDYVAGQLGVDENASLKLVWRFASDWGRPQLDSPGEPDFVSVTTNASARLEAAYQAKGYVRPWGRCLHLDVRDGSIRPGEMVTIVLGDTSRGSPGSRAQTFRQQGFEFRMLVDAHGTWQFVRLPDVLRLNVRAGPAERLVVIAPSAVEVGERARIVLKVEDKWGNPADGYRGSARVELPASGESLVVPFGPQGKGLAAAEVTFPQTGRCRLVAVAEGVPQRAESNPIGVLPVRPQTRPFWGDLHGQSEPTIGTGTIPEYFDFARSYAALDFTSHQGNDFQITRDQWRQTQEAVRDFTEEGRFVAFLGYEWSGNPGAGGDHNVLHLSDEAAIHRSSHMQVEDTSDIDTDRHPVEKLFEELREKEAIAVAHVGGRPADMRRHDEQVQRLVEIHSAWGTFEWLLVEALELGHRVGVVAGSDDHSGRPGASYPGAGHFGTMGGLTCVYATELTKQAVWEALRARRCYGTSGPRILLDLTANGHAMGQECSSAWPIAVEGSVAGTAPVERIDVFRGVDLVHTIEPLERQVCSGTIIRVSWSGARVKGRAREARWDGALSVARNRIVTAEPYAFDGPAEGITEQTESEVHWRSRTCGDADGVILHVATAWEGTLAFSSAIAAFELRLRDLQDEPFVVEAGGLGLRVVVEATPDTNGSKDMDFTWTDTEAAEGEQAYWVRVTQEDGHKAWSSPIFVAIHD